MQANHGNCVNSPLNAKPERVMGGMNGNPYTRIYFDKRTKPQFCWPPLPNFQPQVPRKPSIHRPPPPPCRKTLIRKVAAAAEAKRRSARSAKNARKETKPAPVTTEKGIFGIFDIFANFIPWATPLMTSDDPLSELSSPTRPGSFSSAPGAYPSSFISPSSSTPDLSSDGSDTLPSSSLPSSPNSVATTLSDMLMETLVLDSTDSFLEAAAENEEEIANFHVEEMQRTSDFQKALNEEREKVKRASEWAASEEFKEAQRRHAKVSQRFHALPEHLKEAQRRKRDAELDALDAQRMAEILEAEEKRKHKKSRTPANYVNAEQREAMRKNEKEVKKQMEGMKRRRDEERRRNAARRAEEAAKAETNKAKDSAAAAQDPLTEEASQQAARDAFNERVQEAQRKRNVAKAEEEERKRAREAEEAREQQNADRWARGDDLKSYIKHLRRDIEGMRAGKPLPETLAGGYQLLDRPGILKRRPSVTIPGAKTKHTGYKRVNAGYPRPRHLRSPSIWPHTDLRARRSRHPLFFKHDESLTSPKPKSAVVPEDPLQARFAQYERLWAALSNPSPSIDLTLTFATLPWPLLAPPTSPEDFSLAAISAFLFHAQRPDPSPSAEKSRRARLKEELLRWHPDKFEHRVLSHVVLADRELVIAGADAVIKVLNELRSAE